MKKTFTALVATVVLAFTTITPAYAIFGIGDIVLDPSNLAQNILSAERALEQIENQVRSLTNEAQMLLNEARNLESMDFSSLDRLRTTIANAQRLFDQAEGLSFNVDRMREEYNRLYPTAYGEETSREQMSADARERWQNSRDALDTALQLQAQSQQNFAEDESVLADLVEHSQHAVGALQATQATNQLLALQARQHIQAQQLQITEGRAEALERARAVAEEARARELRSRFMTRESLYTPELVSGL